MFICSHIFFFFNEFVELFFILFKFLLLLSNESFSFSTFKNDITDRLLKEATKTLAGLKLANVEVPAGRHKILLHINDSQGRTAEKELAFRVE